MSFLIVGVRMVSVMWTSACRVYYDPMATLPTTFGSKIVWAHISVNIIRFKQMLFMDIPTVAVTKSWGTPLSAASRWYRWPGPNVWKRLKSAIICHQPELSRRPEHHCAGECEWCPFGWPERRDEAPSRPSSSSYSGAPRVAAETARCSYDP